MKPKPALDIDALIAQAAPPRPNPQLALTVPVRVDSETNAREHWRKKYDRKQRQKEAVALAWPWKNNLHLPCVVRLTRVGQKKLDDDNLRDSFKAIRDQIANELGCDDGSELIKWEYAQVAVGKRIYQVRIEIH